MERYIKLIGYGGLGLIIAGLISLSINATLGTITTVFLSLGLVLLLVFVIRSFNKIKRFFEKRSTKYGTNAFAMAVMVIGILVLINFISKRHNYRIDTTAGNQFSLAEQTKKVLRSLKKEVKITAFFRPQTQKRGNMEDLLAEYAYYSNKIKYEFIDPDKKPAIAKRYGITAYGTTVVEGLGKESKEEKIYTTSEQDLTNAIIKVTREGKKTIYFLEGHGEKDIDKQLLGDKGGDGYSEVKKAILNENYAVKKILLASEQKVPDNCTVLVIAGPRTDLLVNERNMIKEYIDRGGNALFLLDPKPYAGLEDFLDPLGFKVGDDIVLDVSGVGSLFGAGPSIPLVTRYEKHAITEDFRIMTAFPYVRSISPKKSPGEGISVQALAKTSNRSWGETNIKSPQVRFDEGEDLKGPITIAAVATKKVKTEKEKEENVELSFSGKKREARIVVFGDSDFCSNAYFHFSGNGDLFMNTISWLAEEEDLISIRPKSPEDRRVNLTKKQSKTILVAGVILFPLAIFAVGVIVYIRRR